MPHKHIYGPVPSRRLGFSLGIDLVPFKNCSFDCVYCQLGKTTNKTIERKEYSPTEEVLKDLKNALKNKDQIDYITFSGSGEPTLHSKIGYLIKEVKNHTDIPIAVLTNGSLLYLPQVQTDICDADVVLPTLCAVTENIFRKINRAHRDIKIERIIQGLENFSKHFKGEIWLEIMLIKGMNDSSEELKKIKQVIAEIKPKKVHLNTVVRPPSEKFASPLSIEELSRVKEFFGNNCEIITSFEVQRQMSNRINVQNVILDIVKRRPVTISDIANITNLNRNEIVKYLDRLEKEKKIKLTKHSGQQYFEAN
jgi:wyosine [tRNA(Phe)-imidazoG37] synthetase (radical SAM superfamily)